MVKEQYSITVVDELTNKPKKYLLRRFKEEDIHRIFMAWNNPQSYRYNSIDWRESSVKELSECSWPSSWGMYFFVLEDLTTNEIVSTCRFGGMCEENEEKIWDFGYSTFRGDDKGNYTIEDIREVFKNGVKKDSKSWGKGYSSIMLAEIIKIAQKEGVKKLISGADGMNWGSQKVMIKNGMTFYEIEKDGDVNLILNLRDDDYRLLPINKPTKEELAPVWEQHMEMVKKAHNKLIMRLITKKNNKEQFAKSLMFFLLTKASKILETQQNKSKKIALIKQQILNCYEEFTNKDKKLFKHAFKSYKKRWRERIGNTNFKQADVEYYLKCCEIVEDVLLNFEKGNEC